MIATSKTPTLTVPGRLALALALAASAVARGGEGPAYRPPDYLLAIGVGDYAILNPVPGTAHDPELIAAAWPGVEKTVLRNREATKNRIMQALRELPDRVPHGGFCVILLSGHGGRHGGQWEFCPHDFDPAQSGDTGLSGGELAALILKLQRRMQARVLLIVNACHAGGLRSQLERNLNGEEVAFELDPKNNNMPTGTMYDLLSYMELPDFILLASSIPAQSSIATNENSCFPLVVAAALRGAADDDGDGLVTLREVRRYLTWRVPKLVAEFPSRPGLQALEQDCLLDWPLRTSESTPLSRVKVTNPFSNGIDEYKARRYVIEHHRPMWFVMKSAAGMASEAEKRDYFLYYHHQPIGEGPSTVEKQVLAKFEAFRDYTFDRSFLDLYREYNKRPETPGDVPASLVGEWRFQRRIRRGSMMTTAVVDLELGPDGQYLIKYTRTDSQAAAGGWKPVEKPKPDSWSGSFGHYSEFSKEWLYLDAENKGYRLEITSRKDDTIKVDVGITGDPLWDGEWTLRRQPVMK